MSRYFHMLCTFLVALCTSGCAYEQPGFREPADAPEADFDRPDSFDIYVDNTGPSDFYAQVEHAAIYTRREDYERDAPTLYARAAHAGLPMRFVFGTELQQTSPTSSSASTLSPQWTKKFETWGHVVTFSSPEAKYVSGCVSQNAYAANLRIHRYQRGIDGRGVQLRDYHLAVYPDMRSKRLCVGLVETERGSPNACDCPGQRLKDAVGNLRASIQQGLQDSGMSINQAAVLAAALAPLAIIAFAPVGL